MTRWFQAIILKNTGVSKNMIYELIEFESRFMYYSTHKFKSQVGGVSKIESMKYAQLRTTDPTSRQRSNCLKIIQERTKNWSRVRKGFLTPRLAN
jgi:hypothetical protein